MSEATAMSPEAVNALVTDLRNQINDLSMVRARLFGVVADKDKVIRELTLKLEAGEVVKDSKPKAKK